MTLGKPRVFRADPAGCLWNEQAVEYFQEQNVAFEQPEAAA